MNHTQNATDWETVSHYSVYGEYEDGQREEEVYFLTKEQAITQLLKEMIPTAGATLPTIDEEGYTVCMDYNEVCSHGHTPTRLYTVEIGDKDIPHLN